MGYFIEPSLRRMSTVYVTLAELAEDPRMGEVYQRAMIDAKRAIAGLITREYGLSDLDKVERRFQKRATASG